MIKSITLSGNNETVGYAVDAIRNKKMRYEIVGATDSFAFADYEIKSVDLRPSKKDPYHLVAKLEVKSTNFDYELLVALTKKMYGTLSVKKA
jgi:hypothetical protein